MPLRFSELVKRLRAFGVDHKSGSNHSNHLVRGNKVFPMPYTMKEEVSDKYIKACCRTYDIDPDVILNKQAWKKAKRSS